MVIPPDIRGSKAPDIPPPATQHILEEPQDGLGKRRPRCPHSALVANVVVGPHDAKVLHRRGSAQHVFDVLVRNTLDVEMLVIT